MSASVGRADYEVRALRIVPDLLEASSSTEHERDADGLSDLVADLNVHLPVLLHYDAVSQFRMSSIWYPVA